MKTTHELFDGKGNLISSEVIETPDMSEEAKEDRAHFQLTKDTLVPALVKLLHELSNKVRVLEGKRPVDIEVFRTYMKSKIKESL